MKNLFLTKTRWLVTIILLTALGSGNVWGDPTLCTSTSDLVAGDVYYISPNGSYGSNKNVMAKSTGGNNYPLSTFGDSPVELTLGGSSGAWTFSYKDGSTTYYVNATSTTSSNYLKRVTTNDNYGKFSIAFGASNQVIITCTGKSSRHIMRYNSGSSCISCYSSGQNNIYLYKKPSCSPLTMSEVTATAGNGRIDLSWAPVSNANSYTVTCKKKSDSSTTGISIGSISGTNPKTCSITGLTNGTEYTWSVMPVGTGSYCADNTPATGDATPNVFRTITYYDKDGQHTTSLADGTNIATALTALYGGDDPVSCDATNYEYFVGWKVGEISGTASSVTLLDDEVVNASSPSNNYYAVWSDTDPSAGGSELFNFEGGVASDLTDMTGVTPSGLGTDYAAAHAPYRVKLDGTGDYVIIAIASQPSKVTIGVKMIGGNSTSSITVQESTAADGTFTDVEELSISGAQNDVLTLETSESFKSTTRAVKLYFTKGSNVGLGPITIEGAAGDAEYITTCCDNVVAAPTVTATDIKTDEITLSWTHVTGANNYTVTCAGATIGSVQSSGSTRTCKLTGLTHNVLYSWSVVATYSEPYCDATAAEGSTRAAAWKNYYVDRMHGTNDGGSHTVTISGTIYNCYLKEGVHTTPTISDNTTGATACNTEHDHLIGWVVSTEIDANGLPILGYTLLAPGAANTATADGTIYYAIWGKLAE